MIDYYRGYSHAAGCMYYHTYSGNSCNGYDALLQFWDGIDAKHRISGWPKQQAIPRTCTYLELDDKEHLTILYIRDEDI